MEKKLKKRTWILLAVGLVLLAAIVFVSVQAERLSGETYTFVFEDEAGQRKTLTLDGWDALCVYPIQEKVITDPEMQEFIKRHPEKVQAAG